MDLLFTMEPPDAETAFRLAEHWTERLASSPRAPCGPEENVAREENRREEEEEEDMEEEGEDSAGRLP